LNITHTQTAFRIAGSVPWLSKSRPFVAIRTCSTLFTIAASSHLKPFLFSSLSRLPCFIWFFSTSFSFHFKIYLLQHLNLFLLTASLTDSSPFFSSVFCIPATLLIQRTICICVLSNLTLYFALHRHFLFLMVTCLIWSHVAWSQSFSFTDMGSSQSHFSQSLHHLI